MGSKIIATGAYLPALRKTNDDLAAIMDTSDEWIRKRTGIVARHISVDESTAQLAGQAAAQLLERSGVSAQDISFIIVATMSPDSQTPSTACLVQHMIGASNALCFDLSAACSGFVYALHVASHMMSGNQYAYGLVLGAETMSRLIDWQDRSTAVLFGDGAGGVLLARDESDVVLAADLHSDGSQAEALSAGSVPLSHPWSRESQDTQKSYYLTMNGRAVFDFVLDNVPQSIREVCTQAQCLTTDIDYYVVHQANARIIQALAKKMALSLDKFPMTIAETGNVSAASIPILLDQLVTNQQIVLQQKQRIILSGFGGGLSWGSLLIKI